MAIPGLGPSFLCCFVSSAGALHIAVSWSLDPDDQVAESCALAFHLPSGVLNVRAIDGDLPDSARGKL